MPSPEKPLSASECLQYFIEEVNRNFEQLGKERAFEYSVAIRNNLEDAGKNEDLPGDLKKKALDILGRLEAKSYPERENLD